MHAAGPTEVRGVWGQLRWPVSLEAMHWRLGMEA